MKHLYGLQNVWDWEENSLRCSCWNTFSYVLCLECLKALHKLRRLIWTGLEPPLKIFTRQSLFSEFDSTRKIPFLIKPIMQAPIERRINPTQLRLIPKSWIGSRTFMHILLDFACFTFDRTAPMKHTIAGLPKMFSHGFVISATTHDVTAVSSHRLCSAVASFRAKRTNPCVRLTKCRRIHCVNQILRRRRLHRLVKDVKCLSFVTERDFRSRIKTFFQM